MQVQCTSSVKKFFDIKEVQYYNRMTMTENSSLGPIDLSVPKSKSSCSETSREPQYPSIPRIFPKDSQPIPNFDGYTTAPHPYLNHTERWLIQNTICSEPVVLKKSIKRSMSPENGFKRSNASPDNSSGGPEGLKIKNFQRNQLEVNSEMQGVKRRPSDCSTSSSISSFDQDSNNNENLGFKSSTTKRTDESLSPEEKKPRTILNGTVNAEESFIKREITTPEQSRLGSSPASSFTSETDNPCDSSSTRGRPTRPFKAITSGMIIDPIPLQGPLGDFETFRQNILSKVSSNKSTNHNMRRQGNAANTHITDPAYWEKRRKNNEAAKRSRDARRRKEDEVAIRCAYLEQERILMLQENRMLRETLEKYQQYGLIR